MAVNEECNFLHFCTGFLDQPARTLKIHPLATFLYHYLSSASYIPLEIQVMIKWRRLRTHLQGQLELQQLCVAGGSVTEQFGIVGIPLNGLRVMFHS